jgi:SAM-dependent methyltransferase
MKEYAVLCNPGHNRVYFKQSLKLASAELAVASRKMSAAPENVRQTQIGGIDYLAFSAEDELGGGDLAVLSSLSFAYALFEVEKDCLRPIRRVNKNFVDGGISSILKYAGKTNELFTRMMTNVALYSQDNAGGIRLLDPVAGKGTTLYEGLVRGFHVYGIEIGEKAAAEAYHFMKKFLESEKHKHKSEIVRVSGPNRSFTSTKYSFEITKTKNGEARRFEMVAGDCAHAGSYYKKNFFDIIVGDLPYGVRHGNVTNEKQTSHTRNPAELLESCLSAWVQALKPGGAVALSWNTNVLPRGEMEGIFAQRGLRVQNGPAYLGFAHRVDQSVARDIVAAVKA